MNPITDIYSVPAAEIISTAWIYRGVPSARCVHCHIKHPAGLRPACPREVYEYVIEPGRVGSPMLDVWPTYDEFLAVELPYLEKPEREARTAKRRAMAVELFGDIHPWSAK